MLLNSSSLLINFKKQNRTVVVISHACIEVYLLRWNMYVGSLKGPILL